MFRTVANKSSKWEVWRDPGETVPSAAVFLLSDHMSPNILRYSNLIPILKILTDL